MTGWLRQSKRLMLTQALPVKSRKKSKQLAVFYNRQEGGSIKHRPEQPLTVLHPLGYFSQRRVKVLEGSIDPVR